MHWSGSIYFVYFISYDFYPAFPGTHLSYESVTVCLCSFSVMEWLKINCYACVEFLKTVKVHIASFLTMDIQLTGKFEYTNVSVWNHYILHECCL